MSASAAASVVTRPALAGVAGLLAIVVALAALHPGRSAPPAPAPILEHRALRFDDRADGAVIVRDAQSGAVVDTVVGQQGFLRQTVRGLALAREAAGFGREAPFTLDYYADGRLVLRDPDTARQVELEAFGPTNEAVFARFLYGKVGVATASGAGDTVR